MTEYHSFYRIVKQLSIYVSVKIAQIKERFYSCRILKLLTNLKKRGRESFESGKYAGIEAIFSKL